MSSEEEEEEVEVTGYDTVFMSAVEHCFCVTVLMLSSFSFFFFACIAAFALACFRCPFMF